MSGAGLGAEGKPRTWRSGVLLLLLVCLACGQSSISGDLDVDGDVDATDRALLEAALANGWDVTACGLACDLDGDGLLTNADVAVLEAACTQPQCAVFECTEDSTQPYGCDRDRDGLSNPREIALGTDPDERDTDGDGLNDGHELSLTGTDPLLPDTDGGGRSDGLERNLDGTDPLEPSDDIATLTTYLRDSLGYQWDIHRAGVVRQSSDYDGGEARRLDGKVVYDNARRVPIEDGGRELVFGPVEVDSFRVSRKVFVPEDDAFVRFLEIIDNPGHEPRTATFGVASELRAGSPLHIVATSEGGVKLGRRDDFVVTRFGDEDTTFPAVAQIFSGPGSRVGLSEIADHLYHQDEISFAWDVDVPAGGRVILMHFGAVRAGEKQALEAAVRLRFLEGAALAGMSESEQDEVVNFVAWPDADRDGLPDRDEPAAGTDSGRPDSDGDGLRDGFEVRAGLDPLQRDTDGDGLEDGGEDQDGDGLPSRREQELETDPLRVDTDRDRRSDRSEVEEDPRSDPLLADTDGDGLEDGEELRVHRTDPTRVDTDDGGRTDGEEIGLDSTDPLDPRDDFVELPAVSNGGWGFDWPITQYGEIDDVEGLVDSGLYVSWRLSTYSTPAGLAPTELARTEDAGTEMVLKPTLFAGVSHHRKISLPADDSFIRYLEVFENTTLEPTRIVVTIGSRFVSEAFVEETSNGDDLPEPRDDFVQIRVPEDGPKSTWFHVFSGPGARIEPTALDRNPYYDDAWDLCFEVSVPPLGRAIVMHFASVNPGGSIARRQRQALRHLQGSALAGLDPSEQADIVNFSAFVDSDGDGLPDDFEGASGADPSNPDSDGDGLLDGFEVHAGLDPSSADSDGNGTADGEEDGDGDGLSARREQALGSEPSLDDTDADGRSDGEELDGEPPSDPFEPDTDGDGLLDGDETDTHGTDPTRVDTDGGGQSDFLELAVHETDPLDPADDRIELPATLVDGAGNDWVLMGRGTTGGNLLSYRTESRWDYLELQSSAEALPGGREMRFGPSAHGELRIERRVFVPDEDAFLRTLEIVENPSSVPIDLELAFYDAGLGLGRWIEVVATSDGDTAIAPGDRWVVTDDRREDRSQPTVALFAGRGARTPPSAFSTRSDGFQTSFELTVPARGRAIVMHFDVRASDRDAAIAAARDLATLAGQTLEGITAEERLDVVNFDARTDSDGDGLPDEEEARVGSDPASRDTDGDGLADGFEVEFGLDPLEPGDEVDDADGDGLDNGTEARAGTSPVAPDSDGDGLGDGAELALGTDPLAPDTDGDGLADGFEAEHGFDPQVGGEEAADPDADGVDNLDEMEAGSNPHVADSDGDGLADGEEIAAGSDPSRQDTDEDALSDLVEVRDLGTDPLQPDTDGDGLLDGEEVGRFGTSPLEADSDGGGEDDGVELGRSLTDPLDPSDDLRRQLLTVTYQDAYLRRVDPATGATLSRVEITTLDGPVYAGVDIDVNPLTGETWVLVRASFSGASQLARLDPQTGVVLDWAPMTTRYELAAIAFDDQGTLYGIGASSLRRELYELARTEYYYPDYYYFYFHYSPPPLIAYPSSSWWPTALGFHHESGLLYHSFGRDTGLRLETIEPATLERRWISLSGRVPGDIGSLEFAGNDAFHGHASHGNYLRVRDDGFVEILGDGFHSAMDHDAIGMALAGSPFADRDRDGLSNRAEAPRGTSDSWPDSDFDSLLDGFEVRFGLDPLVADDPFADLDGDGLDTLEEQSSGTRPDAPDTDADGIDDGREMNVTGTDPTRPDSDDDGLDDGREVDVLGTDPLDPDSDGGGRPDGVESLHDGTDPLDPGDDGPGLFLATRDRTLDLLDPRTLAVLESHPLKLDGGRVIAVDAMAVDPATWAPWMLVRIAWHEESDSGDAQWLVATSARGEARAVGRVAESAVFTDLAFDHRGVLYGVTGESGGEAESLFRIDLGDATPTLVRALPQRGQRELLAFLPDRRVLYRMSHSTRDDQALLEPALDSPGADPGAVPVLEGRFYGSSLTADGKGGFLLLVSDHDLLDFAPDGVPAPSRELPVRATAVAMAPPRDRDLDGLPDAEELRSGTDPHSGDSDGDGLGDDFELRYGFDPIVFDPAADSDGDGLEDLEEQSEGTDPRAPDSDGDGVFDSRELALGIDPLRADSDDDGALDGIELDVAGTDPLAPDSDGGGRSDGVELQHDGTDPLEPRDDRRSLVVIERLGGIRIVSERDGSTLATHTVRLDDELVSWVGPTAVDPSGELYAILHTASSTLLGRIDPATGRAQGIDLRRGPFVRDPEVGYLVFLPDGRLLGHGRLGGLEIDPTTGSWWEVDHPLVRVDPEGSLTPDPTADDVFVLDPGPGESEPSLALVDLEGLERTPLPLHPGDFESFGSIATLGVEGLVALADDGPTRHLVAIERDGHVRSIDVVDEAIAGLAVVGGGADADRDGLPDGFEELLGTDPARADSDEDGMGDGIERALGFDPLQPADGEGDPDHDGLSNTEEVALRTNPMRVDSDGDGLSDGEEVLLVGSHPGFVDTDEDGLSDMLEVGGTGTSPLHRDSDGGGRSDLVEILFDQSDPGDLADDATNLFSMDSSGRLWTVAPETGRGLEWRRIFLGGLRLAQGAGLATHPQTGALWVRGSFSGFDQPQRFLVVQPETGIAEERFAIDSSYLAGMIFDADGRLLVSFAGSGSIGLHEIDTESAAMTLLVPSAERDFYGQLALDEDTGLLYRVFGSGPDFSFEAIDVAAGERSPIPTTRVSSYYRPAGGLVHLGDGAFLFGARDGWSYRITRDWSPVEPLGYAGFHPRGFAFESTRDSDEDGLRDAAERVFGTSATEPDSDGDGLRDGFEKRFGLDPLWPGDAALDPDGDGLDNLEEQELGTAPVQPDSDEDELDDAEEVALGTDPTSPDTDGDGLWDWEEVLWDGTDPLAYDTDGGGRSDGDEVLLDGTDPLAPGDDQLVSGSGSAP